MNNTNKTRGWNIFGIIIGVALIIVGVILPFIVVAESHTQYSVRPSVSFSGDYYTYQHSATLGVERNTATSAMNSHSLAKNVALYAGIAFGAWGLLTIVHYGKALAKASDDNVSDKRK